MKRIIHALAVLWPLPPRMGPMHCESANPQIREFANPRIRESALKSDFLAYISVKFGNKTSFSDIYSLTKGNLRQARNLLYALRSRNSYVIALTILFMCLIAALNAPAQTGAAANTESIQPLQIGDKIPEELWHLPLQVVNHPEGKETITLNDYRGKLIILDFWATWCGSCMKSFPTIADYNQRYTDSLAIILVNAKTTGDSLSSILSALADFGDEELVSIVNDTMLKKLFPIRILPYNIWIDDYGRIRAHAFGEYLSLENIEAGINRINSLRSKLSEGI